MELQKFVDILDQDCLVVSNFFEKHGKNIFESDTLLLALTEEKWSRKKMLKLFRLEWTIRMDISLPKMKKKHFNTILPIYKYFSDYINNCCSFFGDKLIPWEEWEDLAKEQVDILQVLVKKNQLKSFRRTNIYREFSKKYRKRLILFKEKGYLTDDDFEAPSGL